MEDKYKGLRGKSKGQIIGGMVVYYSCAFLLPPLVSTAFLFATESIDLGFFDYIGYFASYGIPFLFFLRKAQKYYSYYKETFGKNAQNNVPPSTPQQTPQPQPVVPKDAHVPTPAPVQQTADENDEDAEKREVLQTAFTHLIKMRGAEVLKTPPVAKSIMSDLTFNKHKDTVTAFCTMLEEMNNGKSFSDKQSVKRIMKFLENAFKENGTAVPEILLKAKNENGL